LLQLATAFVYIFRKLFKILWW